MNRYYLLTRLSVGELSAELHWTDDTLETLRMPGLAHGFDTLLQTLCWFSHLAPSQVIFNLVTVCRHILASRDYVAWRHQLNSRTRIQSGGSDTDTAHGAFRDTRAMSRLNTCEVTHWWVWRAYMTNICNLFAKFPRKEYAKKNGYITLCSVFCFAGPHVELQTKVREGS